MTQDSTLQDFQERLGALEHTLDELAAILRGPAPDAMLYQIHERSVLLHVRRDLKSLKNSSQLIADRLEQMDGLVKTSSLITSSLELNHVLSTVVDMIVDITGAERVYLMLRNEQTGEMEVRAARNWDKETVAPEDAELSRTVISTTLQELKPIITVNAQSDARFLNAASVAKFELRSILCIPLELRGKTAGVLYADNRISQGAFHENLIPILTAFSNQATIAIENARLFGRVQAELIRATEELKRLRIEVDHGRVEKQVDEITESDYFQGLQDKAQGLRKIMDGLEE